MEHNPNATTVLVAEDDASIRAVLQATLRSAGYRVLGAGKTFHSLGGLSAEQEGYNDRTWHGYFPSRAAPYCSTSEINAAPATLLAAPNTPPSKPSAPAALSYSGTSTAASSTAPSTLSGVPAAAEPPRLQGVGAVQRSATQPVAAVTQMAAASTAPAAAAAAQGQGPAHHHLHP